VSQDDGAREALRLVPLLDPGPQKVVSFRSFSSDLLILVLLSSRLAGLASDAGASRMEACSRRSTSMPDDHSPVEVWHDPIVAEVRQAHESLSAEANYAVHEFCRGLSAGKHPLVTVS